MLPTRYFACLIICIHFIKIIIHVQPLVTCIYLYCFHFLSKAAFAQSIMQGYGLTPVLLLGKDEFSNSFYLYQTNFTYFPRYNFIENNNSSISIGAPVGIGFGVANSDSGDPGLVFAYDLPAALDYNIGCKSTAANEHYFGGYIGAGFGYYHVSVSGSTYSNFKGNTYGPLLRAGVRIGSAKESFRGHAVTIGFFYKKGLEAAKLSTIGCNALVDL